MSIDRARASLTRIFTDSVYILRTAIVDDGGGGTSPDPAGPSATGPILGAFSRQSGRELVASSQVQQRGTYRLALPVDTDVTATDQIGFQGKRYNVVFAPPLTNLNLSRVVELEEAGGVFVPPIVGTGFFFLLESGDHLLLESGDRLLLEAA